MTPLHIQLNTERFTYYAILLVGYFVISSFVVLIAKFIESLEDKWNDLYDELCREKHPLLSKLKKLRHSVYYYTQPQRTKQAIKIKLKSYNIDTTLLDTMLSPQQLYNMNNPLWARGVSISDIEVVMMLSGNVEAEKDIRDVLQDQ